MRPERPRHSAANVPPLVYGPQAEEKRALFLAAAGSASDPDVVAREIGKAIRAMGLKTCYLVDPNANEWRQLRDNRFNTLSPQCGVRLQNQATSWASTGCLCAPTVSRKVQPVGGTVVEELLCEQKYFRSWGILLD